MNEELEPITITAGNIDEIVRGIKKELENSPGYIALPRMIMIQLVLSRKRYKGKGRPKRSDYDFPFETQSNSFFGNKKIK